jgi:hypothetical protein
VRGAAVAEVSIDIEAMRAFINDLVAARDDGWERPRKCG